MTADLELPTADVSESDMIVGNNIQAIRLMHATPGGGSQLRFLRFRPARELQMLRDAAAVQARLRLEQDPDAEVLDWNEAIAADLVVATLDDALRVNAPANQIADPPRGSGYLPVPFPLDHDAREQLYETTEKTLRELLIRNLPGKHDGWAWRVEINVSDDDHSMRVTLTPRNERFEDPVPAGDFTEQQKQAARRGEPVEVAFIDGPLAGQVKTTDALGILAAGDDGLVEYVVDREAGTASCSAGDPTPT